MTHLKTALAAVTLALGLAPTAHAVGIFINQQQYLALEPVQQANFVAGVYDSHAVLMDAGLIKDGRAHEVITRGIRCSGNISAGAMRDQLTEFLKRRDGAPTDSAASLLFFALAEMC